MDTEALRGIFTTLPVDIVASALFATVITVDTLRSGASRAISFGIALVVATVLYAALPGTFMIGPMLSAVTPTVGAGIFAALTVLLTFVLYRMSSTMSDDSSRPMLALATGAATTVVLLTVWQMSVLTNLWHFNEMIAAAFGATYRFYWLLLAFIAFAFVKS